VDYRYTGPGPHEDAELGLIRPGGVREFDEEPSFGPWELLETPGIESEADPAEVPEPRPDPGPPPVLSADELAALKKTADAELAAPPTLTAQPAKEF
jgi:hypothetical protein